MPIPTCPVCGKVVTPSNRGVRPWGDDGPELHTQCADGVDEGYQTLEALRRNRACVICHEDIDDASEAEFVALPAHDVSGAAHRYCYERFLCESFEAARECVICHQPIRLDQRATDVRLPRTGVIGPRRELTGSAHDRCATDYIVRVAKRALRTGRVVTR